MPKLQLILFVCSTRVTLLPVLHQHHCSLRRPVLSIHKSLTDVLMSSQVLQATQHKWVGKPRNHGQVASSGNKGGCRAGRLVNPITNWKTTKQNGTTTKAHQNQCTSRSPRYPRTSIDAEAKPKLQLNLFITDRHQCGHARDLLSCFPDSRLMR